MYPSISAPPVPAEIGWAAGGEEEAALLCAVGSHLIVRIIAGGIKKSQHRHLFKRSAKFTTRKNQSKNGVLHSAWEEQPPISN